MLKNSEFWKPITDNTKVSGAPTNTTSQQIPSLSSDECDNSALKSGEEKIQQERYKVFIEDVADGFYEVDLQGNFTFFNDAMCRIFGYPSQEIKERNYREFMDKENADIAFEAFNKIYQKIKIQVKINQ